MWGGLYIDFKIKKPLQGSLFKTAFILNVCSCEKQVSAPGVLNRFHGSNLSFYQ